MDRIVMKEPASKRENYRALYERAKRLTTANPDASVPEEEVLLNLKKLVPIDDEDVLREREAKRIIDFLGRTLPGEHDGQLHFEDFGSWDWDPLRLLRSDDGDLIENCKATLRFKIADAARSNKHADEALASSRRKQHEANVFMKWTYERMSEGADPKTLTWEACVEDMGILSAEYEKR